VKHGCFNLGREIWRRIKMTINSIGTIIAMF
jgi:hypothetical protein